jgi:hypothetical protein
MNFDRTRPRLSWHRAVVVATCIVVVGTMGAKPSTPGISYRMKFAHNMGGMPGTADSEAFVLIGHGVALGSRNRLDLDSVPSWASQQEPFGRGDYLLTFDSGRVVAVSTSTKTYVDGFSLEMSVMQGAVAMPAVTNVIVRLEKLGAGDRIEGRPTERYRLTSQYTTQVGGQAENITNEFDISTTRLPASINTPFSGVLPKIMSTGGTAELYAKMSEAQKQIRGTPIRVATTTGLSGPMPMSVKQWMWISDIKPSDVDEKALQIPDGYTARPPTL